MRRDIGRFQPKSVAWRDPSRYSFIRKGEVGDHASLFSAEQLARFEVSTEETFGKGRGTPWGVAAIPAVT